MTLKSLHRHSAVPSRPARSRRGSDSPPDYHSLPRRHSAPLHYPLGKGGFIIQYALDENRNLCAGGVVRRCDASVFTVYETCTDEVGNGRFCVFRYGIEIIVVRFVCRREGTETLPCTNYFLFSITSSTRPYSLASLAVIKLSLSVSFVICSKV